MSLSPEFLALLRCPESKEELIYFPDGLAEGEGAHGRPFLLCPASRLRYDLDDNGIPVLLADEAERLDESACASLLARAQELGLAPPASLAE